MTNYHCPTRFTPEQMKILSANPFTYKVSAICIHYTLEFKNLFLAHYEAGEPVKDIFAAFGYDPAILGDNRMYAFARRISKQAKEGKVPTEDSSSVKIQKPAKVDYNTLPAQQSVSAMQREIRMSKNSAISPECPDPVITTGLLPRTNALNAKLKINTILN